MTTMREERGEDQERALREILAGELTAVRARAGIDHRLQDDALRDAVHRAIAGSGGSCTWMPVGHGWLVTMDFPEQRRFFGQTLDEALTWCLRWLVTEQDRHRRQPSPGSEGWSTSQRAVDLAVARAPHGLMGQRAPDPSRGVTPH